MTSPTLQESYAEFKKKKAREFEALYATWHDTYPTMDFIEFFSAALDEATHAMREVARIEDTTFPDHESDEFDAGHHQAVLEQDKQILDYLNH